MEPEVLEDYKTEIREGVMKSLLVCKELIDVTKSLSLAKNQPSIRMLKDLAEAEQAVGDAEVFTEDQLDEFGMEIYAISEDLLEVRNALSNSLRKMQNLSMEMNRLLYGGACRSFILIRKARAQKASRMRTRQRKMRRERGKMGPAVPNKK